MRRALLAVGVVLAAFALGAQTPSERWTVIRNGAPAGSAPARLFGEVETIDALSLCDALGIAYQRDESGRYILLIPEQPVTLVPDGAFAQVGVEIVHFPLPVVRDGVRLFVPGEFLLDLLQRYAPGTLRIDRAARRIEWERPASDVLELEAHREENAVVYRITLAYPYPVHLEPVDSTRLELVIEGARLGGGALTISGDSALTARVLWDAKRGRAVILSRVPLYGARLQGPDLSCRITVRLQPAEENGNGSLAYGDTPVEEELREAKRSWRIDKIIIDPGHGGKDPGAVGRKKTREKDIALDIGLRLRKALRERSRAEVLMTRDDDTFIPLGERTRIANRSGGKLFVSIHCNSSRNRRAHGLETYFLSPARTERAMKVALKENSVIQYEESRDQYKDLTEENFILLAMAQAQFVKESEQLAALVQKEVHKRTRLIDRGVDQAGFYVLIGASMPAILIETAFISNPNEEGQLRSKAFRQKLADGICDAILEFIDRSGT